MHSHVGHVCVFDPSDGLWRGVGSGFQVLLVGVLRDTLQVLQVQRLLMSRDEVGAFVIQDALWDSAEHALRICIGGDIWTANTDEAVMSKIFTISDAQFINPRAGSLSSIPFVCSGAAN